MALKTVSFMLWNWIDDGGEVVKMHPVTCCKGEFRQDMYFCLKACGH